MQNHCFWQPSATITTLQQRATLLKAIRQFFEHRGVLEVDTPTMSQYGVTDQHLVSFTTAFNHPNKPTSPLFLVTSPEYHMKRLIAAGSGPIYQINHCFRNEEMGRYHNPEFTLLEWYRPCFELFDLINEVDDLLQLFFKYDEIEMLSYQQACQRYLEIDPLTINDSALQQIAYQHNFVETEGHSNRDTLLQFLFGLIVEPQIGKTRPTVVYHFPASQAALAELSDEDPRVAKRFEVYFKGVELANGFKELTDATEQRQRFELDNLTRQQQQLPTIAIDENFLAALDAGLPKCSGVALGLDRLIMLILEKTHLREVLSFSVDLA